MVRSRLRKWLSRIVRSTAASPLAIEVLEDRGLLLAAFGASAEAAASPASAANTPIQTFGVTLHLQATYRLRRSFCRWRSGVTNQARELA